MSILVLLKIHFRRKMNISNIIVNLFFSVFFYLVDKVLVAGVVGGDDGEYVPVILLHDVQHDRGLLLDGWSELEKHGVVILESREKKNTNTVMSQTAGETETCRLTDCVM